MQTITTFPEQLLLREIASGSESAFVRVFDYYRPPIYTLALRYTRNEWVAEEIVQDVFTKVWIHRASLTEVQNFGGWIYKIAEGLTINAVKRLVREREKAEQFVRDPLSFADSATRMEEENKYQALLHEAIQKLPTRQQQTYLLIKQRGLKREEAAK
ncbi:MAG TPA: sigma-70 family RNA polymerase sigma factor, partial [Parasegetibacter sp.]